MAVLKVANYQNILSSADQGKDSNAHIEEGIGDFISILEGLQKGKNNKLLKGLASTIAQKEKTADKGPLLDSFALPMSTSEQDIDSKNIAQKSPASDSLQKAIENNESEHALTKGKNTLGQVDGLGYSLPNAVHNHAGMRVYNKEMQSQKSNLFDKGTENKMSSISDKHTNHNEEKGSTIFDIATASINNSSMVQSAPTKPQVNNPQVETLNLSHINLNSGQGLIERISAYIEQAYVAGSNNLDVIADHNDLGQFRVSAHKSATTDQNQVRLTIEASTAKGEKFFVQRESELMDLLSARGIKVTDLRITAPDLAPMNGQWQSRFQEEIDNSLIGQYKQNNDGHSGERDTPENDSNRRSNLWRLFQEQRKAA